MHQQPLVSILFTIFNQRDIIEPTLASILEIESFPFELIIIDDASTDGSAEVIQSLLDYYQHEQTYYFEHPQHTGRGNSFNEALLQSSGDTVWAPDSLHEIDESQLKKAARSLSESDHFFAIRNNCFPESKSILEWINFIKKESWPGNGEFLWNRKVISAHHLFFNPLITHFCGTECAARLFTSASFLTVDPFFKPSKIEKQKSPGESERLELIFTLLRNFDWNAKEQSQLLQLLESFSKDKDAPPQTRSVESLMEEAVELKKDGRFGSALELIEHVLEKQPNHPGAKEIKIEILEKKRRFVEASELKHELHDKSLSSDTDSKNNIMTSIIIPTALYGKPALEQCLISISEEVNPRNTELIIIDNASLDDTHDYLSELKEKNFYNCTIITNKMNKGFAASVNQGLEAANGTYACIMHNDVQLKNDAIGRLARLMELYPKYAVLGPMTNKTLNPDQSTRTGSEHTGDVVRAEYLDSFCLMVRTDTGLRMDESYQLSFFEDIDFCFQARKKGYAVGITPGITVDHHYGTTTFALNLDTESRLYWRNVSYFNEKWGVDVYSEEELKSKSTFDQLLMLDDLANPLYPEPRLKAYFHELFTDELKTEILRTEHDDETLCSLVHLMMVMDNREVMRRLEDRLDDVELPASLIYQLVRFYFDRNIYSRCLHYLKQLKAEQQSLQSELYKLKIMVNEKELEKAVPRLTELLEKNPSNPILYKLAGDIHQFEGNDEEADSFYNIARQIDPFRYSEEDANLKNTLL